ncbi:hypothetical protein CCU68_32070 [Pseudomonas gingeri NCPPB 3146 = LMG 5327]|uniref:Activation-induced cytidine deaminase AID domain-containing protein n=3 Tax=Pseudomonas gingeri TaxID=117681 RepID=A0A7Y7XVF1_9PSED|nr:hypothetical protein [Pseudomonas gingeri]NWC12999.1 hypothetical protein [Pseudomonas gingeri]PNQ88495.1 hypothetical protein CCU68_32070 [Pseudomonas gingeri NCPPB 3146 = LMG 5327]
MTLVMSPEFIRHKRSHDAYARQSPGYVYLISRFDDDDSTICTFGSMGYLDAPLKTGVGGVAPVTLATLKLQRRVQPADLVRGPFIQGSHSVPGDQSVIEKSQQGGGHAEELFLRKLPQMFDEYGPASKIDIFVSRIPCASQSSNWILPTPDGEMLLPAGCANKLAAVIRSSSGITWRIWWEQGYTNPVTQTASIGALTQLRGMAIVQQYFG